MVSGVPRGGTTWLHEMLHRQNDAVIWEPLHFEHLDTYRVVDFQKDLGLTCYIPEQEEWEDARRFFELLFHAELPIGMNPYFQVNRGNIQNYNGLALKFCRANMLLPWLTRNFPTLRPIYLVRHPLTTISSQWSYPALKDVGVTHRLFDQQRPRFSDIYERFEHLISKATTREAVLANWWAIQNIVPLEHSSPRWLTVTYEELFVNPTKELERIGKYLNRDLSDRAARVEIPSSVTAPDALLLKDRDLQLNSWHYVLQPEQAEEIMYIVKAYGITLYDNGPMPTKQMLIPEPVNAQQ